MPLCHKLGKDTVILQGIVRAKPTLLGPYQDAQNVCAGGSVLNSSVFECDVSPSLQDVGESLDPSLNPILSKNTIQRGNNSVILIGDAEIEYNSNFRLYMTSPLANPHFLPEVCIKVTVINFTVTLDGLQDQLLSRVVKKERPQLEESRRELLQGLVTDRSKLRELEDRALSLLHSSRGKLPHAFQYPIFNLPWGFIAGGI